MGSKNRIYLGVITALLLHHHRNSFSKEIYLSKRTQDKIKTKHSEVLIYTAKMEFTRLLNATIASTQYKTNEATINFIAHIKENDEYILYSLKSENSHTMCTTIFKLNRSSLKRYTKDVTFKLFNSNYRENLK